jgi:hypothetical protein
MGATEDSWRLRQWDLVQDKWKPAVLSDELNRDCYSEGSCLKALQRVWDEVRTAELRRRPIVETEILRGIEAVNGQTEHSMPFIDGRPGQVEPRKVLSIQHCTHCHNAETGTAFAHIENRKVDESEPKLSRFLTGNKIDASFENLTQVPPVNAHTAKFKARNPGSPDQDLERQFHDLGRRRLHLAAVLIAPNAWEDTAQKLINQYSSTGFAH